MENLDEKSNGNKMKMLHLLYQMDLGNIKTDSLAIEDELGHKWIYSEDYNDFIRRNPDTNLMSPPYIFFQEYYDSDKYMDYLDITVNILTSNITIDDTLETDDILNNIAYNKARYNISKIIEKAYMDLNMEIDNCQGCMSDLDVAFKELKIYAEILNKIFDINVETEHSRMYKEWCDNYDKEKSIREKELNPVFTKFKFNALDLMVLDDTKKLAKIMLDFLMEYNINIDALNTQEKLLQEKLKNM